MKTINVPLDELKPGDVVTIPPLVVTGWQCGVAQFNRFGAVTERLEAWGATATRKVEPEFNLTWAEALDQMVTHGRMCKPDCEDCRYRYVEGVWRAYPSLSDDRWVEIRLHLSTPAQKALVNAKWRIVEDENNG